jgi:Rieske 2Fe-2S family protein
MQAAEFRDLIERQRPGWSLEQPFYTSPEIYELERRGWLAEQWYVMAHGSEVPEVGSYIVRELLGESIIILRDTQTSLRGFYNVCRHRGSRVCDQDGRASSLTCPYHAWSYRLDGSLRAAAALPDGIDTSQLGLRPIAVREIGGIVLASLKADPRALDTVGDMFEPGLRYHGIPQARIAARRAYPTRANWKLVIENLVECYHCFPAHHEYCSVMRHVDAIARESQESADAWKNKVEAWLRDEADPASPLQRNTLDFTTPTCAAIRQPIGGGRQTQSQDGLPVAPLMGQLQRFDGGVSTFRCEPFIYLTAPNDYALMLQFLPAGPELTEVTLTWLVSPSAEPAQVDLERMLWLWDVTTQQDKTLIERNAAGIHSRAYTPGPYSKLESWTARFVKRYLDEARASIA